MNAKLKMTDRENNPQRGIRQLKVFKELYTPSWRNIVYYGGRASGKSTAVAQSLLVRGEERRYRFLCTREMQITIKDSVHKLLTDLIQEHNLNNYEATKDSIFNRKTETEFIFKGLKYDPAGIKSMEGIDACWVEEAQTISDLSIDILTPTIRKEGSQLIYTFNRLNELDPVYVRYVMNRPDKTFVSKVNYDVLESAGLLPDVIKAEIEADRNNPELFAHKWLGEPVGQAEMAVINRTSVLEAMNRQIPDDGAVEIGVDVARMGDDRTTFWKRKGLKTIQTKVHTKLRTTQVCDQLEAFAQFNKNNLIKIDDTGVGGGVTDEMLKRGYNVQGINFGGSPIDKDKYPNWISEAWFHLAKIIGEIQLPYDSDLLMELSTRQWKQDIRGKRQVEGKNEYKKRGFRSPDIADACIICYYTPESSFNADTDMMFI